MIEPHPRPTLQISGGVNGTVLYAYDEAGHLLGEYDATGTLIEETVWLGDIPIATLRPNGSTVAIFHLHSDPLNTPRQVTRPSDNLAMWTWNSGLIGTDAANPNPSGAGAFAYNLRFAGQLFDGQAGFHYNRLRDFDPAVGRYVQSDPIGQGGGLDPYLFAINNPIAYSDPNGLSPFQWWWYLNLPKTDDCKQSEWDYCTATCSPFKALGCYVTLKWKLKGLRGGNPIRSEQRNVECRCEDPDDCPLRERKNGRAHQRSSDGYLLPGWWWEAAGALL